MARKVFDVWPDYLERSVAPEAMTPEQARILQRVDLDVLRGRLRRGAGCARVNVPANAYTITSCGIAQTSTGLRLLFQGNAAGSVQFTADPAVLWADEDVFGGGDPDDYVGHGARDRLWGDMWAWNFQEDGPEDEGGGGGY